MKSLSLAGLVLAVIIPLPVLAATLIPVSFRAPGQPAVTTGAGQSGEAEFAGGGRYVVFLSDAGNLVTNDTNDHLLDVFRRDLEAGRTELVSAVPDAVRAPSMEFSASADGQRVVFMRRAGRGPGVDDVFVRDLAAGTTRLVSVNREGTGSGNDASGLPVISGDGQWVAFESAATNLVAEADANNLPDVFLRNLDTGVTELLSRTPAGTAGSAAAQFPLINHDGSVALFFSTAADLVTAQGYYTSLFVWRRETGGLIRIALPGTPATALNGPLLAEDLVMSADGRFVAFRIATGAPLPSGNTTLSGIWWCDLVEGRLIRASETVPVPAPSTGEGPSMSADGRTLAFTVLTGAAPNPGVNRVRIWTEAAGLRSLEELQITVPAAGEPPSTAQPVLSPDATSLLFITEAAVPEAGVTEPGLAQLYHRVLATGTTRLVSTDTYYLGSAFSDDGSRVLHQMNDPVSASDLNDSLDVVVTRVTDGTRTVVSLAELSEPVQTATGFSRTAGGLSDDGAFLSFFSLADDLSPLAPVANNHGFVFDRQANSNLLVNVNRAGTGSKFGLNSVVMCRDGHHVLFLSSSPDLAEGDTNTLMDVFVRDLVTGVTELASALDGTEQSLNSVVADPQVSGDGRWVAFRATASSPPFGDKLYLRDVREGRTYLVNNPAFSIPPGPGGLGAPRSFALSADGSTVVFGDSARGLLAYRHPVPVLTLLAPPPAAFTPSLSSDGQWVVYVAGFSLSGAPLEPGVYRQLTDGSERRQLLPPATGNVGELQLSGDGSVLTYIRRTSDLPPVGPWQIWAYSTGAGTEELVSVAADGGEGGDYSRGVQMSADGRFVVFRSNATNLVPGDSNGVGDVFLRDRYTATTTLLSRSAAGLLGDATSSLPRISGNGRVAAFTTFAGNLLPGDFNGASDVVLMDVPAGPAPDTDGDGLADGWELDRIGSLAQNAAGDADGDGQSNGDEFAAHTLPGDAGSRLELGGAETTSGTVVLDWRGHAGVRYQAERRASLAPGGEWTAVGEPVTGFEGTLQFEAPAGTEAGYFRIRAGLEP